MEAKSREAKSSGALYTVPTVGQDSHMLGGLARASCLINFAAEDEVVYADTPVPIDLINWSE